MKHIMKYPPYNLRIVVVDVCLIKRCNVSHPVSRFGNKISLSIQSHVAFGFSLKRKTWQPYMFHSICIFQCGFLSFSFYNQPTPCPAAPLPPEPSIIFYGLVPSSHNLRDYASPRSNPFYTPFTRNVLPHLSQFKMTCLSTSISE